MKHELSLFVAVFTTLLAVINPLEALPIYLHLLQGQDEKAHRTVAFRSCLYAAVMMVFFLFFGRLILHLFGVSLSMVRVVGGIILMRIGFSLFSSSGGDAEISGGQKGGDIAFMPLAIPIMFGPRCPRNGDRLLINVELFRSRKRHRGGILPCHSNNDGCHLHNTRQRAKNSGPYRADGNRRRNPLRWFLRIRHGHRPDFSWPGRSC
jgi:hypothetical protein